MNIHSAGVGAGDQRRTQPGSSQEGGRHPAKCRYKLPSGAGLFFLLPFFPSFLHFCTASVLRGWGSGDATEPGRRAPAVCLSISRSLCDLCSFSFVSLSTGVVAGQFRLHKLLAGTPGLGAGKGQRAPCE